MSAVSTAGGGAILQLDGIVKHYGDVLALNDLNVEIRPGEIYGFLGRNGAGKSTALKIIMGIVAPDAGHVRIKGAPMRRDAPELRRMIGYVAQEQNFYGWMDAAMIGNFVGGFYPTWDGEAYDRLIERLGLPWNRKIAGFSGGMMSKLALALALAHHPELLVLDEPTAGMDAVARREFIELVIDHGRREHRTTIFSTHLIDEVELAADRVGIVDHGTMTFEGSLDDLRTRVRRIVVPALVPVEFPRHGFRVLADHTAEGTRSLIVASDSPEAWPDIWPDMWRKMPPDMWNEASPDMWRMEIPSLEDIFVAMVGASVAL